MKSFTSICCEPFGVKPNFEVIKKLVGVQCSTDSGTSAIRSVDILNCLDCGAKLAINTAAIKNQI